MPLSGGSEWVRRRLRSQRSASVRASGLSVTIAFSRRWPRSGRGTAPRWRGRWCGRRGGPAGGFGDLEGLGTGWWLRVCGGGEGEQKSEERTSHALSIFVRLCLNSATVTPQKINRTGDETHDHPTYFKYGDKLRRHCWKSKRIRL